MQRMRAAGRHNPEGGCVLFALPGLLRAETLVGLSLTNGVTDERPRSQIVLAPVANAITDLHAILCNLLVAAVVLHVHAILAVVALEGENPVRPMITARKRPPAASRAGAVRGASAPGRLPHGIARPLRAGAGRATLNEIPCLARRPDPPPVKPPGPSKEEEAP